MAAKARVSGQAGKRASEQASKLVNNVWGQGERGGDDEDEHEDEERQLTANPHQADNLKRAPHGWLGPQRDRDWWYDAKPAAYDRPPSCGQPGLRLSHVAMPLCRYAAHSLPVHTEYYIINFIK